MVNEILNFLDKPLLRYILIPFLYANYKRKGLDIIKIRYISECKKWYYKVGCFSFISTSPGWAYSYDFCYQELKKYSAYDYIPSKGDTVVDLGAGIGEETIVYSHLVGESGKVLSIEANPRTYRSLSYIVNENKFQNVILLNCALGGKNGTAIIEDDPNNYLGNSISFLKSEKSKYFEVKAYTLDSLFRMNNLQKIDLLKSNIEGAEQFLILGMKDCIRQIKNVAISCHDFRYKKGDGDFFKTKELIVNFLIENDFHVIQRNANVDVLDDWVYAHNKKFKAI